MRALKSEWLKLVSVRTTWALLGSMILIEGLTAGLVTRPAASPSMRTIAPSRPHVVRTETSFSHSERSAFIARSRSRR